MRAFVREEFKRLRDPPQSGMIGWGAALLGAISVAVLWPEHPRIAAVIGANVVGGLLLYFARRGRNGS